MLCSLQVFPQLLLCSLEAAVPESNMSCVVYRNEFEYRRKNIFFPRKTVTTTVMTCRYTVQNVFTNRSYECDGVQSCNNTSIQYGSLFQELPSHFG